MARKGRHKRKVKITYSIVVDGQTEVWYFQMMKKHEKLPRTDIKPELPKKKKLADQYHCVLQNGEIYDQVIWVVDFDTILKESAQTKSGHQSALQQFYAYLHKLKKHKNIKVLINTPCLEYWFLLHFKETNRYYSKCENTEKQLKKSFLSDYEKTEKYFKRRDNDIYLRLRPLLLKARVNAQKLGSFDISDPESAKSEMYQILNLLGVPF